MLFTLAGNKPLVPIVFGLFVLVAAYPLAKLQANLIDDDFKPRWMPRLPRIRPIEREIAVYTAMGLVVGTVCLAIGIVQLVTA
jgi:hypothetical protein